MSAAAAAKAPAKWAALNFGVVGTGVLGAPPAGTIVGMLACKEEKEGHSHKSEWRHIFWGSLRQGGSRGQTMGARGRPAHHGSMPSPVRRGAVLCLRLHLLVALHLGIR